MKKAIVIIGSCILGIAAFVGLLWVIGTYL